MAVDSYGTAIEFLEQLSGGVMLERWNAIRCEALVWLVLLTSAVGGIIGLVVIYIMVVAGSVMLAAAPFTLVIAAIWWFFFKGA